MNKAIQCQRTNDGCKLNFCYVILRYRFNELNTMVFVLLQCIKTITRLQKKKNISICNEMDYANTVLFLLLNLIRWISLSTIGIQRAINIP